MYELFDTWLGTVTFAALLFFIGFFICLGFLFACSVSDGLRKIKLMLCLLRKKGPL